MRISYGKAGIYYILRDKDDPDEEDYEKLPNGKRRLRTALAIAYIEPRDASPYRKDIKIRMHNPPGSDKPHRYRGTIPGPLFIGPQMPEAELAPHVIHYIFNPIPKKRMILKPWQYLDLNAEITAARAAGIEPDEQWITARLRAHDEEMEKIRRGVPFLAEPEGDG